MRRSAAIALAAGIGRTVFLGRPASRTDARVAEDPDRRLEFLQEDRPGKVETLRIADFGGRLQIGELLERLHAYEQRVKELETELGEQARENRELLKLKIEELREQVETERVKSRVKFN